VSEVDDAQDAVNHRIAQCDDGINAAKHQSVQDLLDEDIHLMLLSPCDWIRVLHQPVGGDALRNLNGTAGTDVKDR
jgi:hypothetical protein